MSILRHPLWPTLRPYVRAEVVEQGRTGPRYRFEVDTPRDRRLTMQFAQMEMTCVACRRTIHPVEQRRGWRTMYLHFTCSVRCRNGGAAREEARAVADALSGVERPSSEQSDLFE